ncbi:expressed protein, partial [Phakopsora pachyrhizi]
SKMKSLPRLLQPYYCLRLLSCLPALLYLFKLSESINHLSDSSASSNNRSIRGQQQIHLSMSFLSDQLIAIMIPLVGIPLLVSLRLRQIRKTFKVLDLSTETLLESWFAILLVYNLGVLIYVRQWNYLTGYLFWLSISSCMFSKPKYQGPSKLRTVNTKSFSNEVLNRSLESLVGFSADDMLRITPEELERRSKANKSASSSNPDKLWIVWPLFDSTYRTRVGFMDVEVLLSRLSLSSSSKDFEILVLDVEGSSELCYELKLWGEDDYSNLSSKHQSEEKGIILLVFRGGKELRRIPPRPTEHDSDSSDGDCEASKNFKSLGQKPFLWTLEAIRSAIQI